MKKHSIVFLLGLGIVILGFNSNDLGLYMGLEKEQNSWLMLFISCLIIFGGGLIVYSLSLYHDYTWHISIKNDEKREQK